MADVRILREPEVLELTGLSRVTIWRKERRGEFPSRVRLGENSVGWRSDEVEEWIESRPSVNTPEGEQVTKKRTMPAVDSAHRVKVRHVDGEWSMTIDGEPLKNVRNLKYVVGVDHVPSVTVEFQPSEVEIETDETWAYERKVK